MTHWSLSALLLALSYNVHAQSFKVVPQAMPVPTAAVLALPVEAVATAVVLEAAPAASPKKGKKLSPTATPTLTPTPTPSATPTAVQAFYLLPFEDRRKQKMLSKGRSTVYDITAQAIGLTQMSKTWIEPPFGDMALLWHRQLASAMARSGMSVIAADEPSLVTDNGLSLATDQGARYGVSGVLRRLDIEKRGADPFLGTAFGGFNYTFRLEADIKVTDLFSRQTVHADPFVFERRYADDTTMGADDMKTYPYFFEAGMNEASAELAGRAKLRALVGLPAYTPTPSATATPTRVATVNPREQKTATPTPGPHFINPKTGKAVNPAWNFDPEDGTARKDFIEVDAAGAPMAPLPTATPTVIVIENLGK